MPARSKCPHPPFERSSNVPPPQAGEGDSSHGLSHPDLDAPAFARVVGMPFAEIAQAGRAAADLTIEVEPGAAKEPPLDVRGLIAATW